jgi:hypothetical protein
VRYDIKTTGDVINAYAAHYWMQNIVKVTYFLLFLFWYLDHTLASNRGTSYSFYFPVQLSYWKSVFKSCSKKKDDDNEQKHGRLRRVVKESSLGTSSN